MNGFNDIIRINSGKRFGKPCVRDTRITVYDVLGWLSTGMTIEEIITDFPELTRQDILACLSFSAQRERTIQYAWHEVAVRSEYFVPYRAIAASRFADCRHVRQVGLNDCSDSEIWQFARANDFTVVTFDGDTIRPWNILSICPWFIVVKKKST